MKIKEIIVVEGKNDTNVLQSYLECDTIETHGTSLGEDVFLQIEQAQKTRGVIVFTDPDHPGEKIRNAINQRIKGCKNAFIDVHKAKTPKKVGVEHANKQDILEALDNLMTYDETVTETLSKEAFIDLGLQGGCDASKRREIIGRALFLGKPNAKTLFKRLNMLQVTKAQIEELLRKESEESSWIDQ